MPRPARNDIQMTASYIILAENRSRDSIQHWKSERWYRIELSRGSTSQSGQTTVDSAEAEHPSDVHHWELWMPIEAKLSIFDLTYLTLLVCPISFCHLRPPILQEYNICQKIAQPTTECPTYELCFRGASCMRAKASLRTLLCTMKHLKAMLGEVPLKLGEFTKYLQLVILVNISYPKIE